MGLNSAIACRASRHASSAAAAARGERQQLAVGVQPLLGRTRQRVAVDGLQRRDPLDERVDARPSVGALVTLLEPAQLRAARALRVARSLELRTELLGLGGLRLLESGEGGLERLLHPFRLRRHRAAGPVDRARHRDERVAHGTEPTVEPTCPVDATTRESRQQVGALGGHAVGNERRRDRFGTEVREVERVGTASGSSGAAGRHPTRRG